MVQKLRERMGREEGFTLVELLVVMLILGILAAIAIPSFFAQRDKARDADAKAQARTAETAAETYATDHDGGYVGMDETDLEAIEDTLDATVLNAVPGDFAGTAAPITDLYAVSVTSSTGNVFTITRDDNGDTHLVCTTAGDAGCPEGGDWG